MGLATPAVTHTAVNEGMLAQGTLKWSRCNRWRKHGRERPEKHLTQLPSAQLHFLVHPLPRTCAAAYKTPSDKLPDRQPLRTHAVASTAVVFVLCRRVGVLVVAMS